VLRAVVLIGREDMKHRIQWLRGRADEVRNAAKGMRYAETRGVLFRIAESYENMATHLETAAERLTLPRTSWALAKPIGEPLLKECAGP
jgi:hypothetical protein